MNILPKIVSTTILLCTLCAFSVDHHCRRNTELVSIFQALNNKIETATIDSFNTDSNKYLILPLEHAELLHLLGHLTGHDCFVEIGHVVDRRFFDRQQYDSIYRLLEFLNFEVSENDLSKWLDIQKNYIDFYKGDHMNYILFFEVLENWTDSITDNELHKQLLNEYGDWKFCYDEIPPLWYSLPDSLARPIRQLLRTFPQSKYLRYKLELDSLAKEYYELKGILKNILNE